MLGPLYFLSQALDLLFGCGFLSATWGYDHKFGHFFFLPRTTVIGRLDMYRTKVLLYRTIVLFGASDQGQMLDV